MKIFFVYRDYKGARRGRYAKMMSALGHQVKSVKVRNKLAAHQVTSAYLKKYEPDLLWILQPAYVASKVVDQSAIEYAKTKGIPIATYWTYGLDKSYKSMLKHYKIFDFLFMHNLEHHKYLKEKGLNSYYMPIGFYPEDYFKTINYKHNKLRISFMGRCQTQVEPALDKRSKYINSLEKYGIRVYGSTLRPRIKPTIPVYPYSTHKEQRQVYSMSKINLSLPFLNSSLGFYKNKYHIKNRIFEIPATHNFLLTARCNEFLKIFGEDTIGYYDDNINSLRESVDKYLKDKKQRVKMSENAYNLVHEKHTFSHRFEQMFKIIGSI